MTLSLRKAGFACGAFAFWGLAGCDMAETNAPVAGTAATSSNSVAAESKDVESRSVEPKSATEPASVTPPTIDKVAEPAAAEIKPAATESTSAAPASPPPAQVVSVSSSPPPPADRPRPVRQVAAKPGEMQEVTFDTIKLPMEKDQPFNRSLLTKEVLALDGQPIRIRGYILPSFQQTGITQFVLVRDNLQCCFGPGAALFDCIIVEMKPGKSADYTVRPVSVEGKFTLAELVNPDDGKHLAIYHLDGEKVQ